MLRDLRRGEARVAKPRRHFVLAQVVGHRRDQLVALATRYAIPAIYSGRANAEAGKPARIIAKLNALVDSEIIEKLYEASCAGVKIDLVVRGICCLRPKVPGLSENIRVVSIVGRFLEHSRVYYFENAGNHVLYLSSADWMPRNLVRRVEVAFPVEAPELRKEIIDTVLPAFLTDNVKSRELQPDGTYLRLQPKEGEKSSQAAARLVYCMRYCARRRETPIFPASYFAALSAAQR